MGSAWGETYLAAHAARLAHLGTSPLAEVRRAPGLLAVASGVSSNTENGVVCFVPSPEPTEAMIGDLVSWFGTRRLPASWVCEEIAKPDLRRRLLRLGFQEESGAVAMGAHLASVPVGQASGPQGVRLAAVRDDEGLEAWLEVAESCGWFDSDADREARRRLYRSLGLGPDRPIRHYVARRGRRAVGMATAFFAPRTVVFENVAVVEGERRRGVGTALATARLVDARRAGYETAVLSPSPEGAALYRSIGFEASPQPLGRWFYLPLEPSATHHL